LPIIQAVDRALRILDLFDEHRTELKITEISRRTGLHKSTVHSLLKTLQAHGYIDQNADSGKYRLGLKLVERGNLVLHSLDVRTVARGHLLDLSRKTGLTVHLVILDGKEGVYIDKVEGTSGIVMYSRIGRRVPIHSSAVGKVLVAFQSEEVIRNILDGYEFVPHTPNTITDERTLSSRTGKSALPGITRSTIRKMSRGCNAWPSRSAITSVRWRPPSACRLPSRGFRRNGWKA